MISNARMAVANIITNRLPSSQSPAKAFGRNSAAKQAIVASEATTSNTTAREVDSSMLTITPNRRLRASTTLRSVDVAVRVIEGAIIGKRSLLCRATHAAQRRASRLRSTVATATFRAGAID